MKSDNEITIGKDSKPRALARLSKAVTPSRGAVLPADEAVVIETGFEAPKRIGLTIAFLVFGVFGVWACVAPIEGAAHGSGAVTVKSYKKVIQHLEGGIVKDILVQNGDAVDAGEILMVLDETQSLAQLEIYSGQLMALTALEARLIAERDNLAAVVYPAILTDQVDQSSRVEVAAQNQIFNARKASHEGAIAVLQQQIGQLESQVVGLKALKESKEELAASFEEELVDVRALLSEGFENKLRLRELERNHAQMTGEAAELMADIAATEIQIGETRLKILQQDNEFQTDVVNQLSDTQNKLQDTRERVTALKDIVNRTIVRAPVAGLVNGLQFHTEGGVIAPGTPIAEIVPQGEELVIEAKLQPVDIDRVAEGQRAQVRLPAFNTTTVPTLYGTVLSVSADSMIDEATGASYYLSRVSLDPESMDALNGKPLLPGMPAEVFIQSGSRTLLQYLLKPLSNGVARSFIED